MVQSPVTVADDGSLRWRTRRWVRVAPLVFRSAGGEDVIAFREDAQGAIAELHAWGGTFERVSWLEQPPFHLIVVMVSALAFSWYALRTIRQRRLSVEGRAARTSALCVAFINLVFVPWLVVRLRGLGDTTPLPLPDVALLLLPVASALLTVPLPAFAAAAWWHGWWSRRDRVAYTTVVLAGVAFATFLNYWKLLGLRY
jgi:hypothetical protein